MIQQLTHFRTLIFLILGILFGYLSVGFTANPLFWLIAVVVCIIFTMLLRKNEVEQSLGIFTTIICFGAMLYTMERKRAEYLLPEYYFAYEAVVASPLTESQKSYACDLLVTSTPKHCKVKAYFEKTQRAACLSIGDCLKCSSRWQAPHDYFITPRFNYKDYLLQHDFCATTYVREHYWHSCTSGNEGSGELATQQPLTLLESIRLSALKLRQRLLAKFQQDDIKDENYGLLAAMTLGDRTHLSNTLRADYVSAGAAHILALSGLHLTIILYILSKLLFFLRQRIKNIVELLFVWVFVFVSGMSLSIMRVALMFTIMILANSVDRKFHPINKLSLAALLILLFSPKVLFDVSFQLSFMAVLGIFLLYDSLRSMFSARLQRFTIMRWMLSMLCLTLSAQIGTLPITLYHFGQIPTYSIITNSFISVFAIVVLTLTAVAMLLNVPSFMTVVLDRVLQLMSDIVSAIASLPYSTFSNLYISLPQVFIAYALIVVLFIPLYWNKN